MRQDQITLAENQFAFDLIVVAAPPPQQTLNCILDLSKVKIETRLNDTPMQIVAKLDAALVRILADPSVQMRFEQLGIQISPRDQQSPETLRAFQKAEAERWWPIIKASNLKAE